MKGGKKYIFIVLRDGFIRDNYYERYGRDRYEEDNELFVLIVVYYVGLLIWIELRRLIKVKEECVFYFVWVVLLVYELE